MTLISVMFVKLHWYKISGFHGSVCWKIGRIILVAWNSYKWSESCQTIPSFLVHIYRCVSVIHIIAHGIYTHNLILLESLLFTCNIEHFISTSTLWFAHNDRHKHTFSGQSFQLIECLDSTPLQWRHNERDGVSNHQPQDCSLNRLFRRRSKKTSKHRVTGLCEGNSPVTGEFPLTKGQ